MNAVWKKNYKGFTIIELLIVLLIIALLLFASSLLAVNQIKKARDAKVKSDLSKIRNVLYDYYSDQNCFPAGLPECNGQLIVGNKVYLNNFPCDSHGNPYVYETDDSDCKNEFKILTNLEINSDPIIQEIGCGNGCGSDCQYNYGVSSTNIDIYNNCAAYYACSPSGDCLIYDDPVLSGCQSVFLNDSSCGTNTCDSIPRDLRCHDNRGRLPAGKQKEPTPTKSKKSK